MSNPYAPPINSDDEDRQPIARASRSAQFYQVSPSTLVALYLVTFGIYGLYWFYKQWAVQKRVRGLDIWPIARGLFAIFFVHRLFKIIDQTARATGVTPRWNAQSQATMYVVMVLVARVILRLSSETAALAAGLALSAAAVLPLLAAQRVVNLANGRTLDDAETWID
jgi:hypothetical protein